MKALKIRVPDRQKYGYCLDELADYHKCYHKNMPFLSYHCSHQKHHFIECDYQRFVLYDIDSLIYFRATEQGGPSGRGQPFVDIAKRVAL